jgi:hypothetical protein
MTVSLLRAHPHTPNTRHNAALGGGDTKINTHMAVDGRNHVPEESKTIGAASDAPHQRAREPELWHLTFQVADSGDPPVAIRVRRLLKRALRSFGLKCVDYRVDAPASEPAATQPAAEGGVR